MQDAITVIIPIDIVRRLLDVLGLSFVIDNSEAGEIDDLTLIAEAMRRK